MRLDSAVPSAPGACTDLALGSGRRELLHYRRRGGRRRLLHSNADLRQPPVRNRRRAPPPRFSCSTGSPSERPIRSTSASGPAHSCTASARSETRPIIIAWGSIVRAVAMPRVSSARAHRHVRLPVPRRRSGDPARQLPAPVHLRASTSTVSTVAPCCPLPSPAETHASSDA